MGQSITLAPTSGPGTASALARQSIAAGAELILAAGGDGTINEVAEGMLFSGVPLGILPAGTANVLATEMGLGSSPEAAAARLVQCLPERISVGRLDYAGGVGGSRHFLLMAGIGLDAHIVYHVNAQLKAKAGKIAYWLAGGHLIGRALDEFQVELEGRCLTCSFALVSRVRNYGGDFEIARETSLFDDQFEVVLFEGRSPLRYLKYLTGLLTKRVAGMRGVSIFRSRRICLSAAAGRRIHIQVDGEYAGHLPASVELVREALTLLIPPEYYTKNSRRWTQDSGLRGG